MRDRLVIALVPPLNMADAPLHVLTSDGRMTVATAVPAGPAILLLPAADCVVTWESVNAVTPRQAAAAARARVLATAVDAEVHVAAEPTDGPIPVATVSHKVMQHWLSWATSNNLNIEAIVPAALALSEPEPEPGTMHIAALGTERIARDSSRAFAIEPGLEGILTGGAKLVNVDVMANIGALADNPRLNLLTAPYAPPRASWFTSERLLSAAALIAFILLVSLAIGIVRLVRTHADIARIDGEIQEMTRAALGREVAPDIATAELDARLAATGTSRGSANATLAALMQAMETQASVGIDAASWDRAGTLTVTLGATRAEDINPVLLALQASGYRITAQPRQGTDGRALGDITIRSEP